MKWRLQNSERFSLKWIDSRRHVRQQLTERRIECIFERSNFYAVKTGNNEITRTSAQSSVTIPFNVTFRDLERTPDASTAQGTTQASRSNFVFCGCGWPDHMLVPKGTPDGLPGILFAMVTDFETDKVKTGWCCSEEGSGWESKQIRIVLSELIFFFSKPRRAPPLFEIRARDEIKSFVRFCFKVDNLTMDANQSVCDNAFSFCGVRNSRYPDRKAMGFPFDRLPRNGIYSLQQFLTPNMLTQNVSMVHQNTELLGVTLRSKPNKT